MFSYLNTTLGIWILKTQEDRSCLPCLTTGQKTQNCVLSKEFAGVHVFKIIV